VVKARLDKLLVERGLCASLERARSLISEGLVEVQGIVNNKPAAQVDKSCDIKLRKADHPYVSRGAFKLIEGLDHFAIDPRGLVCADIGASTGGFTDVLLRRGASKVYAIDVGYGQLAWSLRQDERVVVMERENVRNMDAAKVADPIELAVIDVSFISLTLILGKVAELMREPGRPILALVKPQFEAGRESVGKGGVVREEAVRLQCIQKVSEWALARGFTEHGSVESPIKGPAGNVEYVLLLRTPVELRSSASH
jgi:23S rRNA (cytidine1920-2'-O)/16S rRNA (cytidine1409-2'-O)-methyltransferase